MALFDEEQTTTGGDATTETPEMPMEEVNPMEVVTPAEEVTPTEGEVGTDTGSTPEDPAMPV